DARDLLGRVVGQRANVRKVGIATVDPEYQRDGRGYDGDAREPGDRAPLDDRERDAPGVAWPGLLSAVRRRRAPALPELEFCHGRHVACDGSLGSSRSGQVDVWTESHIATHIPIGSRAIMIRA